ncbi:hypothetical protein RR48_01224 [Papilio machaon]|uniref:Uncharacterized protein n=1 Tax=Papilio machaon TaxID=76193 RepID=A0A0N0PEN0_PAPMA|nr:hypothetical protein RR48_01224 [Papilio machaon]
MNESPSRSERISFLKAGNASAILLVLRMSMGVDDHFGVPVALLKTFKLDPKRSAEAYRPSELSNRKTLLVQPFLRKNQTEKKPYLLETPIKRKPALLRTPEECKRQKINSNTEEAISTEKEPSEFPKNSNNHHQCCCKRVEKENSCSYSKTPEENCAHKTRPENCAHSNTQQEKSCPSSKQENSYDLTKQDTICNCSKKENICLCNKQDNCNHNKTQQENSCACSKQENSCGCSSLPIVFTPVMMPPAFGSIGVPYMIGQPVKFNKPYSTGSCTFVIIISLSSFTAECRLPPSIATMPGPVPPLSSNSK